MVTRFAMGRDPEGSDDGPSGRGVLSLFVPRSGSSLPSEVQPAATRAIRGILDTAYADACDTLAEHLEILAPDLGLPGRGGAAGRRDVRRAVRRLPGPGDGEWRPAAAQPREWGEVLPFRDRRSRRAPAAGAEAEPEAPPAAEGEPATPSPVAAATPAEPSLPEG